MKSKFFCICLMLLAIGTSSFAQTTMIGAGKKLVQVDKAFTSLQVDNDLSVVLTDDASGEIRIEGNAKAIHGVSVRVVDGKLKLDYLLPNRKPDVVVYVPAALLTQVYINGKGELSSAAVLPNRKLDVTLSDEAYVHLRSAGKVVMKAVNDYDFIASK